MDKDKIKNFIESSRQSGISDDSIMNFLQEKGVNLSSSGEVQTSIKKEKSGIQLADVFPGGQLAKGVGTALSTRGALKGQEKVTDTLIKQQTDLISLYKQARNVGDIDKMDSIKRALEANSEALTQAGQVGTKILEDTPTSKQVIGGAAELATLGLPLGAISKGAGAGLKAIGASAGLVKTGGAILAGGTVGLASDISTQLAAGKEKVKPSLGTAIGSGLPLVAPIAGKIAKVGGKVAAEIQGALTGTSGETIELAFQATRKGGESSKQFYSALRKNLTPEQLAENAKKAVQEVSTAQQTKYSEGLAQIANKSVDSSSVLSGFQKELSTAGITVKEGVLDFSGSKLRTVPKAQTKLQDAYNEVANIANKSTIGEIDTTRQALKALRLAGDDPSANLANKFIDDAVRGVRRSGEKVKGYGKLLNDFAEDAEFLDEVQRSLSTGDRATIDQTYRRLATSLKTNNERRLNLLKELDQVTGGSLLSEIPGQQLSEELPRGLFRQIAAGLGGVGIATGTVSTGSVLPLILFASPRVTGEVVGALGIGARKIDILNKSIGAIRKTISETYKIPESELYKLFLFGVSKRDKQEEK